MKKYVKSNDCINCVFFRKRCVLGVRRPWNQIACREFRPYCLDCAYSDYFCHTCPNRTSQQLKPGNLIPDHSQIEVYTCVWGGC
ncbi:hypothetical protein JCM12178A_16290 [Salidesulfovibrio brasiliensis]